jgi:hypothetical protein
MSAVFGSVVPFRLAAFPNATVDRGKFSHDAPGKKYKIGWNFRSFVNF